MIVLSVAIASGQRIAVLTPDPSALSGRYAAVLASELETDFRVLDSDLAASAYSSLKIENAFNLSTETARRIGSLIGCDHFVLVRAETARRSSFSRPVYYEASAFLFLVNTRTGSLEKFLLAAKQENNVKDAEEALIRDITATASQIAGSLKSVSKPDTSSDFVMFDPDAKTMRPAMPYRRIKPEYTETAFLYDIKATVDAEVSIDESGSVNKIDIVRWAGFGLDEAVIAVVNKMNWRPGERNGKPLPMRVLLRYNFTKIEKEQ